jgi:AbrB family looped-hinge helix DNA binding protein
VGKKIRFVGTRVKLDDKGRIVIPKEVRERFNLKEGSDLELYVEGDKIVLKVRRVTVDDIYGLAGKESVSLEEVEGALGLEGDGRL